MAFPILNIYDIQVSSGGQVRSMQYFAKFNVEILYDDVVCAFSDINATFGRLIRARRV